MQSVTRNGLARLGNAAIPIWIASAALIAAGAVRFFSQPSFWLDEAFVALSLRSPSLQTILAPLEAGQLFPRIYLAAIAFLREILGYRIWVLRLLPSLGFAIATLLWARLLIVRSRSFMAAGLLAGALLLGSSFWLDQAIQLKQYTLDVLLALIPFLLGDEFFSQTLTEGRRRLRLAGIALPCLVSYTYPLALGARLLGWFVVETRRPAWRVQKSSVLILLGSAALALLVIWTTDYRFNFMIRGAYAEYWSDCIISSSPNVAGGFRLLAKFFWGWHGRQPLVTIGMVPLQILGVYSAVKWLRTGARTDQHQHWGSRSIGSLVLLGGMVLASAVAGYPICAGRLTLFTQIHMQILALEGALFILGSWNNRKAGSVLVLVFAAVVLIHSARTYMREIVSEPAENLRPLLPAIDTSISRTIWVHPCSEAQVKSLPDTLPGDVVFGSDKSQPAGKTWVLWSHLGNQQCVNSFEQLRARARSWQTVSEGPDRGLALAEF